MALWRLRRQTRVDDLRKVTMEMSVRCPSCLTGEFVKVSRGPGRRFGPIAHDFSAVEAPLPDDFEFFYCTKCNQRLLDADTLGRFLAEEKKWLSLQPKSKAEAVPVPVEGTCMYCGTKIDRSRWCLECEYLSRAGTHWNAVFAFVDRVIDSRAAAMRASTDRHWTGLEVAKLLWGHDSPHGLCGCEACTTYAASTINGVLAATIAERNMALARASALQNKVWMFEANEAMSLVHRKELEDQKIELLAKLRGDK
jgi:hypothetical protein